MEYRLFFPRESRAAHHSQFTPNGSGSSSKAFNEHMFQKGIVLKIFFLISSEELDIFHYPPLVNQ